jgi:biopolymer transport protein ExbD
MAGGGGGGDGEPEFQIAPMIDVLLVLLIFFMSIATTTVSRYDQSIKLPEASSAFKKENSEGEGIVNVYWKADRNEGEIWFEEVRYTSMSDLVPVLEARRKAIQSFRILIRGDQNVPASYVNRVMEAAGRAGVLDITFSTLTERRG